LGAPLYFAPAAPRPPTPLARPRASPSASARCALRLRASRGGYRLGRAIVLGVESKGRAGSRICLFSPRPRAHPCGCTRDALARVLSHTAASAFAPLERGRAKVFGWYIIEDVTEGICVL